MNRKNAIVLFRNKFSFLSNFYPVDIVVDGRTYPTVENAYQALKCANNAYRDLFTKITPAQAKEQGKRVLVRKNWHKEKKAVMWQLLLKKFEHPELAAKLKATGKRPILHENNWKDNYWGIWKGGGKNLLGKMLMQIRDIL